MTDMAPSGRGTWLRQWRDRVRKTQDEVAVEVGISRSRWAEIEAGQGCLMPTARRIQDITSIQIADFARTDAYESRDLALE